MSTLRLKNILLNRISNIKDEALLEKIFELTEQVDVDKEKSVLSKNQVKELERRRELYLKGEAKTYSWEEMKKSFKLRNEI